MKQDYEALVSRVKRTIEANKIVVVYGWMQSNHNNFTLGIPEDKVRFVERSRPLRVRAGLVLTTSFVLRSDHDSLESHGYEVHGAVLGTGEIRRILQQVSELWKPDVNPGAPECATGESRTDPE